MLLSKSKIYDYNLFSSYKNNLNCFTIPEFAVENKNKKIILWWKLSFENILENIKNVEDVSDYIDNFFKTEKDLVILYEFSIYKRELSLVNYAMSINRELFRFCSYNELYDKRIYNFVTGSMIYQEGVYVHLLPPWYLFRTEPEKLENYS